MKIETQSSHHTASSHVHHEHAHDHAENEHHHEGHHHEHPSDSPHDSKHHHEDHRHCGESHHHHEHGHAHNHAAEWRDLPLRKLALAFGFTASFCVAEAVAGVWFRSLALVADAGHMAGDSAALLLALIAQKIAARSRTREFTFGFRRAEVLAAFVNALALLLMAVLIGLEAIDRMRHPETVQGRGVLVTAIIGLFVNLLSAWILSSGGAHTHNTNTKAALAHVISDALGSVGAIVSALCIMTFGFMQIDAIVSLLIVVLLCLGGVRLLKSTLLPLMEGAPSHLKVKEIEVCIGQVAGVRSVYDLHVWSVTDGFDAVSAHVVIEQNANGVDVARCVAAHIHEKFSIKHVTVQPEFAQHEPGDRPSLCKPFADGDKKQ